MPPNGYDENAEPYDVNNPYSDPRSPFYDSYSDPDSPDYDPYLDRDAPWIDDEGWPWDEPPWPEPEDEPDENEEEKVCQPVSCDFVEVKDGWCCSICYEECSDGSGITTFDCWDCSEGSA
jgi:hypothetical protein